VGLAAEDARGQPQCIALSARFLGWYDELEAAGSSSSKNLVDDSLYILGIIVIHEPGIHIFTMIFQIFHEVLVSLLKWFPLFWSYQLVLATQHSDRMASH
jgi:hypothetical protein